MLLESPADDENSPMVSSNMREAVNIGGKERSVIEKSAYTKSLPSQARARHNHNGGGGSGHSGATTSSSQRSSHSTTHNTSSSNTDASTTQKCFKNKPSVTVSTVDGDISRLPLDARLVPKKLLRVCYIQ